MFTEKEFDSAREIILGFNDIRKQIIDDPKLTSKLYELYKDSGVDVKEYNDVDNYLRVDIRCAILYCYFSLGYPNEYHRNIFDHFDLLTLVYLDNGKKINYVEYENDCTKPLSTQSRDLYDKVFSFTLKFFSLKRFYIILLKTDEYIAGTFLILLKKLALQLKDTQYLTPDGKKWCKKLVYDELELNPNNKPEYIMKSDEEFTITIEPDYFDLIDKITSEFKYFVKNELNVSESVLHYFITHDPFNNYVGDKSRKSTLINTLVLKDIFSVFTKLNHSINIDTLEGKILFLCQLKDADINPDYQTFNNYCYSFSLNPKTIRVRIGIEDLIKQANEMTLGLTDLHSYDFYFKHILDQVDKELSKKYMVLLYRFASVVAKSDGTITEEEEKWLSQMLAMTEKDNNEDKNQSEIRITQGGSNPIEELESLIGLTSVKKDVVSLANFIKMKKMREEKGLKAPNISYHCVFSGNPGTGKTTVARILANIFKELGILKSGHLVETDRSGLVAEYVGQTAVKTNKIIDSALDGVLFIDEAYTLVGGQNDYGKEAIATLLKRMEDDRDRLIVILAGYSMEMEEFVNSNPGLRSRFNRYILFPDYSASELYDIFQLNASKNEYVVSEEANQFLKKKLDIVVQNKKKDFGNARYIRNYFELAIEHQANRLAADLNLTPEKLCELTFDDIDINI